MYAVSKFNHRFRVLLDYVTLLKYRIARSCLHRVILYIIQRQPKGDPSSTLLRSRGENWRGGDRACSIARSM